MTDSDRQLRDAAAGIETLCHQNAILNEDQTFRMGIDTGPIRRDDTITKRPVKRANMNASSPAIVYDKAAPVWKWGGPPSLHNACFFEHRSWKAA